MNYKYHTLICILFAITVSAQNAEFASFKTQYAALKAEKKWNEKLVLSKEFCLKIYQKFSDTTEVYAEALRYIGYSFKDLRSSDSTEYYYKLALDVLKKQGKEKKPTSLDYYYDIGMFYYWSGNYKNAEPYFTRFKSIFIESNIKSNQNFLVTVLSSLAACLEQLNKTDEAILNYREAITICQQLNNCNLDFASIFYKLGELYESKNEFSNSEKFFKNALAEFEKKSDNENNIPYCKYHICLIQNKKLNKNFAIDCYKELYEQIDKNAKVNSELKFQVLYDLVNLYESADSLSHADYLYDKLFEYFDTLDEASKINKKKLEFKQSLIKLKLGNIKSAEKSIEELSEYFISKLGEQDKFNLILNMNVADAFASTSNYDQSEIYQLKAKALSRFHPQYLIDILNNLATVNIEKENYKKAESYFNENLKHIEEKHGKESKEYANCLDNLGTFQMYLGNIADAYNYYKQSLEILIKTVGKNNENYIKNYHHLGIYYYNTGNYESAQEVFLQIIQYYNENNKNYDPLFNDVTISLSQILKIGGNLSDAEQLYLDLLADYESSDYEKDYFTVYAELIDLYLRKSEYNMAENYLTKAKNVIKSENPAQKSELNVLTANFYHRVKDYPKAFSFYKIESEDIINELKTNFKWLSEKERQAYLSMKDNFFNKFYEFAVDSYKDLPELGAIAFNISLVIKSLLLETSRSYMHSIEQVENTELKQLFGQLKKKKNQYDKNISEGNKNPVLNEQIKSEIDSLDKLLARNMNSEAISKDKFEITWNQIKTRLKKDEAVIEFVNYFNRELKQNAYIALVLKSDSKYPELFKIADEKNLIEAAQNKQFDKLYNMIWSEVEQSLQNVKTVFYSPAGVLNNVAFSALCAENSDNILSRNTETELRGSVKNNSAESMGCKTYLMDKYQLRQFSSSGNVLKEYKALENEYNSILLAGAINYDDVPAITGTIQKNTNNQSFVLQNKNASRTSQNLDKMPYLPGTETEISTISPLLQKSGWKVGILKGNEVSEQRFRTEVEQKKPVVLHIATHGFAFSEPLYKNDNIQNKNNKRSFGYADNPMIRTGLMLSGSNISWTGNAKQILEKTGDDGILTAAEVSNLDMSKTKLVVLSACETGLGKIEGSEGTFGLKRGFKLAGVEQIIVSLWSVPDKETMELMTLFYNDLSVTLNPVISFEKAQKEMRKKYPTEPEKWAGFVLVR